MKNKINISGLALLFFKILLKDNDYDYAIGDIVEIYEYKKNKEGTVKANIWIWIELFSSALRLLLNSLFHGGNMFQNYFKTAFRNIKTYKLFSFINLFGLAIGLSAFIFISLWVENEINYDRFHTNADRIYRVERELFRDNTFSRWPITGGRYKFALIDEIPEIENAVRFWGRQYSVKDFNNKFYRQDLYAADNSLFEIFNFDLLYGDVKTALKNPKSVVLTSEKAQQYFGSIDAVGKTLTIDWQNELTDFIVTGVLEEIPENSSIDFQMLVSISSYPEESFESWRSNYLYTYVLLKEGSKIAEVNQKLKEFVEKNLKPFYGDLLVLGLGVHEVLKINLFPLLDIHLNPSVNWEMRAGGSIFSVYLFSFIALLVLIIAGINFLSLSTARANKRAKEVSLRKTIGASNNSLRYQFIQESILLAFLSAILSMILLILLIPIYNDIFTASLELSKIFEIKYLTYIIGVTITFGILSGIYPAFYLSKFEPIEVIRGNFSFSGKKAGFRRKLVVFQFFISVSLIICMLTVYYQMDYVKTKSLGFEKSDMLLIPVRNNAFVEKYGTFKNILLMNSNIEAVAASSDRPGDSYFGNGNVYNREKSAEPISLYFLGCSFDFIETYKIDLLAGRSFSREIKSDTAGTMILNEAAIKRIGWTPEEAVGKILHRGDPLFPFKVVGVIKNFNFKSLKREIEPLSLVLSPNYIYAVTVKIKDKNVSESISYIKNEWEKLFPNEVFNYGFLDLMLNRMYESETKVQNILIVFSVLAIIIAGLGLFGLTSFTTEEKTKEIGIRKTLGATVFDILVLLTKEFLKWIIAGIIIAWPISYYLMSKWLEDFAYRINLDWTIFIISSVLAIVIAVSTIFLQGFWAAKRNPVDSLKYE